MCMVLRIAIYFFLLFKTLLKLYIFFQTLTKIYNGHLFNLDILNTLLSGNSNECWIERAILHEAEEPSITILSLTPCFAL